jgi:hypothetical protein
MIKYKFLIGGVSEPDLHFGEDAGKRISLVRKNG